MDDIMVEVYKVEDVLELLDVYVDSNSEDVAARLYAGRIKSAILRNCNTYLSRNLLRVLKED